MKSHLTTNSPTTIREEEQPLNAPSNETKKQDGSKSKSSTYNSTNNMSKSIPFTRSPKLVSPDLGQPRIKGSNKHNHTTKSPKLTGTKRGKRLWQMAKQRQPSVILKFSESFKGDDEQKDPPPLEFSFWECSLAIIAYLVLGVVAYSFLFEKWSIANSLYFTVVTFTTVGYGDLTPDSNIGKLFTCIFAPAGVASLGIALGVIATRLIEGEVAAIDAAREANTSHVMNLFRKSQLNENDDEDNENNNNNEQRQQQNESISEKDMAQKEVSTCQQFRHATLCKYLPILAILFFGAYFIGSHENWDWTTALYYCIVTSFTIGYGDYAPNQPSMRYFATFYILIAVAAVGNIVGSLANWVIESRKSQFLQQQQNKPLTIADLEKMDTDHDDKVSMLEYVEFMLLTMEKVDQKLLDDLHEQFQEYDVDHSGDVSKEDLKLNALKKMKTVRRKLVLSDYKKRLVKASKMKNNESNQ